MTMATRSASLVWLLAVSVVMGLRVGQLVVTFPAVPSDGHAVAEVLMVLVVAALPGAEMGEALDELDGLDPFDHLEAQLELVAQPQRSAVQLVERLAVHLVGEDGQVVAHVLDLVSVVVQSALWALGEGVKHGKTSLRQWMHQLDDLVHRHAAPLGD